MIEGRSEHSFFCDIFRLLRETNYNIIMKGIDFPTGPDRDFIKKVLLEHLAGKNGITSEYITIGVIASESDEDEIDELRQAMTIEDRLVIGTIPESIPVGYMVMDRDVGYLWNSTIQTPYTRERDSVYCRQIFSADSVIRRWREDFSHLAERARSYEDINVRHLFG